MTDAGHAAGVAIRAIDAGEAAAKVADLADLIVDAVAHGASVNFMAGFDRTQAVAWWRGIFPDLATGARLLLVAQDADRVLGTVQVVPAPQPNQAHRADIAKMLVHSRSRRRGIGALLLAAAEAAARARGRTLLTLDTETDGDGDRLYRRCGFTPIGAIPGYALMPDGSPCAATFFYKVVG